MVQEERWRTGLAKEVKKTRRDLRARHEGLERHLHALRAELRKELQSDLKAQRDLIVDELRPPGQPPATPRGEAPEM